MGITQKKLVRPYDTFRQVWPDKRLIHIFQPHRYSRTQSLFDQFVEVLSGADQLFYCIFTPLVKKLYPT